MHWKHISFILVLGACTFISQPLQSVSQLEKKFRFLEYILYFLNIYILTYIFMYYVHIYLFILMFSLFPTHILFLPQPPTLTSSTHFEYQTNKMHSRNAFLRSFIFKNYLFWIFLSYFHDLFSYFEYILNKNEQKSDNKKFLLK